MDIEQFLVLPQTIMIKWNRKHAKYYREKGYIQTKIGDEFEVNVLDLKPQSNKKVKCICQYCKKIMESSFGDVNFKRDKLCCKKCTPKKIEQTRFERHGESKKDARMRLKKSNLEKYGVRWYVQTEEFKAKSKKTNLKKYGVEFASQSGFVREKVKNTVMKKYGVENISQIDEVKERKSISWARTIYKNGKGPSSTQQRHICDILHGELNYPVNSCLLDIAFPSEKLYIEYDGGGHDLNVKIGVTTREEFKHSSIKRDLFLKERGWKLIRIISTKDKLLNDEKFIELFKKAKEYLLKTNHSWFEVNIDEMKIKCSQYEKDI